MSYIVCPVITARAARAALAPLARLATLVGLLATALAPGAAFGSAKNSAIVNVSSMADRPVEDGFTGQFDVSGQLRNGNSNLLLASVGTTNYLKAGDNLFLLAVRGDYGITGNRGDWNDEPYRERIFEHLRYRRSLSKRWSAETFVQHSYDRWQRLLFRGLVGAGGRLDVQATKTFALAWGLAYMAQVEKLTEPAPGDPQGAYLEHRLSSYIGVGWQITEKLRFDGTYYLQPRIDDPSDVRALLDSRLGYALTNRFTASIVQSTYIDTRQPVGVWGYDTFNQVAITVRY